MRAAWNVIQKRKIKLLQNFAQLFFSIDKAGGHHQVGEVGVEKLVIKCYQNFVINSSYRIPTNLNQQPTAEGGQGADADVHPPRHIDRFVEGHQPQLTVQVVQALSGRDCGYLHPRDYFGRLMHRPRNKKRRQNDVGPGEELRKDGAEEQHLNDGGHVVAVEVEEVHPEDVHRRETEGADEEHVRKELPIALQQVEHQSVVDDVEGGEEGGGAAQMMTILIASSQQLSQPSVELPKAKEKDRVEGDHEEDEGEGDGPVEDEERVEEKEKVEQEKGNGVEGEEVAGVGDGDEEHHSGDEN